MHKLGKNLIEGDVFYIGRVRLVFIAPKGQDIGNDGVLCVQPGSAKVETRYLKAEDSYAIADTDCKLTPAQQHAEDLLRAVKAVVESGCVVGNLRDSFQAVLDKIEPPQPPTLQEALSVVRDLAGGHSIEAERAALNLLDRARRSGC